MLFISLIFLNHCTFLQTLKDLLPLPTFSFDRIEFSGIDMQSVKLRLHCHVENPYPLDIPHAATNLTLHASGIHFIDLKTDLEDGIKSGANQPVQFDVSLPLQSLLALYQKGNSSSDSIPIALKGNLDVYLPLDQLPEASRASLQKFQSMSGKTTATGGRSNMRTDLLDKFSFDVDLKKDVPAVFPEIEIRNFQLKMPSLSDIQLNAGSKTTQVQNYLNGLLGPGYAPGSANSAGLAGIDLKIKAEFDIVLSNKAKATLDLADLNYNLQLAGQKLFQGKIQTAKRVGNTSVARIQTGFPLRSITSAVASAIDRKSAPLKIQGNAAIHIPDFKEFGNINLRFDDTGDLKW